MQKKIHVPVILLVILVTGAMTGIIFSLKNLALQQRLAALEDRDVEFSELQTLRISNEWLKNRVAALQEEKAELIDSAVADLHEKSRIIESILNII